MKNKRFIFIFWALFLVPSLVIAGMAFVLLKNEQERIYLSALHVLSQQAGSVCDTIHLTVEAVQENLEQSLLEINPSMLKTELLQWEMSNPLVRNVFIYYPHKPFDERLEYPIPGMSSTREEHRFVTRYQALFSGRINFNAPGMAGIPLAEKQIKSPRKKLVALSRQSLQEKMTSLKDAAPNLTGQKYIGKKGWIPWFSENHLFLLGWAQAYENGPVYGIELELMALLSRLVADFPVLPDKDTSLVLLDGNSNIMHQSGPAVDLSGEKPVVTVPVSFLLPHWRVAVYTAEKGMNTHRQFFYLSLLLLGIFLVAIVSGGILLTRLTLSKIRDNQQKTSFISSVSHELKTPLTSIRMVAELLLSRRVSDPEKRQTYLSVIVSESQRLTRLINNVLDFGRLEQGRKTYHLSFVDVAGLLNRIISAHTLRITEHQLEMITDIPADEVIIHTDPDAVEQVVLNLIDNAVKYAGKGAFIQFVLRRNQDQVEIKICDDGPGIPAAQQELIFNRFHRIDDSLTADQPGSGLGLSIARQILRDLGGDLMVESNGRHGSCFIALLTDREKIKGE
jgi:signal transduction histidine kinase